MSLRRQYISSLKDTKCRYEALEQASMGLQALYKCGLPEKYKEWCPQFMLIPKLLWPLLIYGESKRLQKAVQLFQQGLDKLGKHITEISYGMTSCT
ncbi:tectonin beta-propeller repeat containing 2 [Plakobranchus ocellatus]|uniref:Tectonin beta-propeller repeat containing 2 n=1 Tax=Plakobranchus ocellatus TaxID=259542 RepID=A0AAV4ABA0_9GAST|nr:tectonin beta-propeller repeat containing 2 [Plakobranchus ocellatus]